MGIKKTKTSIVASATQLIAGTAKHYASVPEVRFTGGTFTPTQITSKLQRLVSLRQDVDVAKATAKARVAAEQAEMPQLRTFQGAYVALIKATFGDLPEVLAD